MAAKLWRVTARRSCRLLVASATERSSEDTASKLIRRGRFARGRPPQRVAGEYDPPPWDQGNVMALDGRFAQLYHAQDREGITASGVPGHTLVTSTSSLVTPTSTRGAQIR